MFRKLRKRYYRLRNLYFGKINFDFDNQPKRWELINKIISKNNYSNYEY